MSELTPQQVQEALDGILKARPQATFDGNETTSYLHVPYRAEDGPLLERIIPRFIRKEDDVTIDLKNNMLHLRITTPENYDAPPPVVQNPDLSLQRDAKTLYHAFEADKPTEDEEIETPYGQRAMGDFFRAVDNAVKDPRALTAAINTAEQQDRLFEKCMDQYANSTVAENVTAYNMCYARARGNGAER